MPDPIPPQPAKRPFEADDGSLRAPEWNKDIKAYYDSIAAEPIPDEIQELMATLARAIRK